MDSAATLPAFPPKLAKMIRMLSADNDGQVLAAARAIDRTLKSAGLDWHDLAAAFMPEDPKPKRVAPDWESPRYTTAPSRWRSLSSGERIMAFDVIFTLDTLSEWERAFARSIYPRLRARPETSLTAKQMAVLDGLLVKVWEQGIKEWEQQQWG